MSGDEITFGEIRLREPLRKSPPSHDPRLACLACDAPTNDDLPIFLDYQAALAIERHAARDVSVELGGVLLGKECVDPATERPYLMITNALEAAHYQNSQASFTYTHDSWEAITRDRDRLFPDSDIVGWYHTHPNFGIFLSNHDLFIHHHFFYQPLQVAYVVDPINQTRGFFQWKGEDVAAVSGFHLTADRHLRRALAQAADQLERIPPPDTPSTRLETELIKMLTRSEHQTRTIRVETLTTALAAGTLGAIAGALLIAMAFWLGRISERVQEQGHALAPLAATVEQLADGQRLAMDVLRDQLEQDPKSFTKRYADLARQRDQARLGLERQGEISETLADKAKQLETRLAELTGKHATAVGQLEESAKANQDRAALMTQLEELQEQVASQRKQLDEIAPWLETDPGKAATALQRELNHTRQAAYIGWGAVVLLSVGIVGLLARARSEDQPSLDTRPRNPSRGQ